MYLDAALKNNQLLSIEKNREFKGMVRNMKTIEDSDYEVVDSLKNVMRNYQKKRFPLAENAAGERFWRNPCGRYGTWKNASGNKPSSGRASGL